MRRNIVRIGLDLDGVILYNPARIVRPLIAVWKHVLFPHQKTLTFYYPKTRFEQYAWSLLHKTSLFIAPGFREILKMALNKEIKLYIITARYDFMGKETKRWARNIDKNRALSGVYCNEKNEQPHLYKERMISLLKLDYFVEDNWDIVKHLYEHMRKKRSKTIIFWVYNILDKKIPFENKIPYLQTFFHRIAPRNKKTGLLIATDYFYPHWTGISKSMLYMANRISAYFFCTVLTVRHKKNIKKEEIVNGVRIVRESFLFSVSRAKYSLSIIIRFIREAKNHDVIFINSPHTHIFLFSAIGKLLRKKVVVFHQGDLILPKGFFNSIIKIVFDLFTYMGLLFADTVSTYTEDYAKHSRVLKPFLQKHTPLLMPVEKPIYKKTDAPTTKVLFGFAGRFVEEKGFDILFDAIPYVIQEIPQARFLFAGETNMGYERFFEKNSEKLKRVKKYVALLGLLDEKKLAEFYHSIDFIIVSSRSDCFPLVQAEAMLCGKPSIVADIPGARVLVQKTKFGVIFEKENALDLAKKIIMAYRQKESIMQKYPNVLEVLDPNRNAEIIRAHLER